MTIDSALSIILCTLAVYTGTILYIRINGLRTFSKMTSFDFAMTIAVGSILGATATNTNSKPWHGLLAIGCLVAFQRLASELRDFDLFRKILTNQPVCLVWKGRILEKNLSKCRVTKGDLYAKLREANALSLERVHAVIFETSGDIAVLHGEQTLDVQLLQDVQGVPT
jgi:uncharacterized membrane protein YcaP (DUF421 family)